MSSSLDSLIVPSTTQAFLGVKLPKSNSWQLLLCQLKDASIVCWDVSVVDQSDLPTTTISLSESSFSATDLSSSVFPNNDNDSYKYQLDISSKFKLVTKLVFASPELRSQWEKFLGSAILVSSYKSNCSLDSLSPLSSFIQFIQTQSSELDLSNSIICLHSIKALLPVLEKVSLSKLVLNNCQLNDQSIALFATSMSSFTSLSHVSLSNNHISSEGLSVLLDSLFCVDIKELILDNNPLGDCGIIELGEVLSGIELSLLSVKNCSITHVGIERFASTLPDSHVRSLFLSHNQIGDEGLDFISFVLGHLQYLSHLDLENVGLKTASSFLRFAGALTSNSSLVSFNICNNSIPSASVFNELAQQICGSSIMKATLLKFDTNFGFQLDTKSEAVLRNLLTAGFSLKKFCLDRIE
ncbi:hypothetical protein GEMRC1_003596 [Eukaryota sp. GEM-RC1]